ncbi:MAG: DUF3857 domain-containing protein [Proteobacteria bacterium]|nr:DUF3857 domain-containing protein [Pseudomonadota bacterium]MBU4469383.1 DUF3857 domain-containing protein [Pseudomonadota bacterium]MCG2750496.1 DUF3857 domain-containing protein [Desulfobacteraceae bacterium]
MMRQHLSRMVLILTLILGMGVGKPAAAEKTPFLAPDAAGLIRSVKEKGLSSETGALILSSQKQLSVEKNGTIELKSYVCGMIFDERAASDYSQICLYYNGYFEEIHLDFARSIQGNGELLDASKDAIQTRTASQIGQAKMYTDMKSLAFSIPALRPGTAFEFMVTRRMRPVVGQNWARTLHFNFVLYTSNPVPRVDPVYGSKITVITPADEKITYYQHLTSSKPRMKTTREGLVYTWEMENVPQLVYESNMPMDDYLLPAVELSSIQDWKQIDHWAHALFAPNIIPSQSIQKITLETTKGISDRNGKIKAIFEHIQKNIEYIEADLGRGGYAPHSADQVLKNKYGDCKDQSTLFVSMLKALGVEAYPAILTTFPYMENRIEIPTPYFNHAITYIPHGDGDLWLDTVATSKFPNLLWNSQDRSAFVVNGQGGEFKKTPSFGRESNEGEMNFHFKVAAETLSVGVDILAKGAMGDIFKNSFKALTPDQRKTMAQDFIKRMYPASVIENVTFSDLSDPDAIFKISVQCRIPYAIPSGSRMLQLPFSFIAPISYFSTLEVLSPPTDRKTDYIIGFGFDIKSQWSYDMTESGFAGIDLPEAEVVDSEFLKFEWRIKEEGRTLRGTNRLTLKAGKIPLERYSDFYQNTQKILQKSHKVLSFQKREMDHAALALETSLKDKPDDVSSLVALAKQYLKNGKYGEANALLTKALVLNPENGESHYFLGIALGHDYKMEEAQKEFETASRLGFIP